MTERRDAVDAAAGGTFRQDIQGLRAVAVLLVLAFHIWPDAVTGGFVGVDAFFVISGFLITAHLLQNPPRRGRDLLEFWGRRIRRLLPAAFLVLAVTAVASRMFAPETRWAANAGEIIASALYVENWVLAGNSVDYLLAEEAPTPVQHYWSLSIEEQFYLVWPILILAIFWFARRTGLAARPVTRLTMLAVVGVSLAISITATEAEPANAYFVTQTRIWELAAGGVIATLPALGAWRLPARWRARAVDGLAWLGLAMVVAAGLLFTNTTPFPGAAALLPVGGTALVILAASRGRFSPTRLLGLRPMQHLGDTSYSIYLWHWPLLVLWPYALGPITPIASIVILGATIALATITKTFVEDTFRFSPSFRPLVPTFRFAAAGMLVLSLVGSAQLLEAQVRLDEAIASAQELPLEPEAEPTPASTVDSGATSEPGSTNEPAMTVTPEATLGITSCVGAAAIVRGFDACPQDPAARMVPQPLAASTDNSDAYRDGCWIYAPFAVRTTCEYGKGDVRIALVGNSHAGQWLPTLQVLAREHGWRITTFLASQCNATDASLELYSAAKSEGCLDYGRWVLDQTGGDAFDLVITSQRQSVSTDDGWENTGQTALAGYTSYLQRWSDAGANVLVLQDSPFPGNTVQSIPDCLAQHRTDHTVCAGTPQAWRPMDPLYAAATQLALPGISTMEVRRFFCTSDVCPAVIGTVIAYFDASHMTATYARSIAPFVEAEILAALAR